MRKDLATRVAWVLVAVYAAASIGVIPSPAAIGRWFNLAAAERYPCEDHSCGCASALECWTHCCCHSEHERLVWAITHDVTPPSSVHFTTEQWAAAERAVSRSRARETALAGDETERCPCQASSDDEHDSPACHAEPKVPSHLPTSTIGALSCKGLQQLLTTTLPPSVPAAVVALRPRVLVDVRAWPKDLAHASRSLDVTDPPPRAGL